MTEPVPTSRTETRIGPGKKLCWSIIGAIVAMAIVGVLLAWRLQPGDKREAHGWRELADGTQMRCFGMEQLGISGREPFEVCAVRVESRKVALRIAWQADGIDYSSLLEKSGAVAAINGGFYDENYMPQGWLVVDGVERRPVFEGYSGLFFIDRQGQGHVDWAVNAPAGIPMFALQSNPLLVEPDGLMGIRSQSEGDFSARSCVCRDYRDRVLLVSTLIAGDAMTGLTLYELAGWLRKPEDEGGLGARVCMNLDGGPLAALHVKGRGMPSSSSEHAGSGKEEKKVTSPTAIVVVPK